MYTPRFNPNSAVSNWKGRLDFLKGYPGAQMMGALNGGFFGGGADFSGGSRSNPGDGYNYQTYTSSGTVTCLSGGVVEVLLVGGGGGGLTTTGCGGGGGGGALHATDLTVEAGDYTLVIGAAGTYADYSYGGNSALGTATTNTGLGGGTMMACGGGYGGRGAWATAVQGGAGVHYTVTFTPASPFIVCGGGGGGGGEWTGYNSAPGGAGSTNQTTGTFPGGGTWHTIAGGTGGAPTASSSSGGGGGDGHGATGYSSGLGAAGYTWSNSTIYGRGGDGMGYDSNTQNTNPGSGNSSYTHEGTNFPAQPGVFIVRWPE